MNVETAVIAAAGTASRLLPASSAVDKALMPIYAGNRPRILVDYTIEALAQAGVRNIVFVTNEDGENGLRNYYDRELPKNLDKQLRLLGKDALLAEEHTRRASRGMNFEYITQPPGAYGTAIPLFLAKKAVGNVAHFAYIAGDDFVYLPNGRISEFTLAIEAWEEYNSNHVLMGNPVSRRAATNYGVLHTDGAGLLTHFDEKPLLKRVPPNPVINISKYLLGKSIWPFIDEEIEKVRGQSEHYITHPINAAHAAGHSFFVHRIVGKYLDGGSVDGLFEASRYIKQHPQN